MSTLGSNLLLACFGRLVGKELNIQAAGRVCANVDIEEDPWALGRVGHVWVDVRTP